MSKKTKKILIIDDDADVLHSARIFLKQHFEHVDTEQNPTQINHIISRNQYDMVLLDMNFKRGEHDGREGLYWLEHILSIAPNTMIILITAYGDIELAVEAMRQGAANFVLKPWKNSKLLEAIETALDRQQKVKPLPSAKWVAPVVLETDFEMIGSAPAMLRMYDLIDKVADTEANVLILGENGTGKELVARALHLKSSRCHAPFVRVDVGMLTSTLFESEMFGHTKGAFTDAYQEKPGKFELAHGGTIFLDEIGNLSLAQQAKLLTVIQGRKVSRVGANQEIPLNIRLICATNMPLYDMVVDTPGPQEGFRQDLLYRINTVEIFVPPLRERPEDIPLLTEYFLSKYAKKYNKTGIQISKSALARLQRYEWPGNVRELQHAVERATILCQSNSIDAQDFIFNNDHTVASTTDANESLTLDENEKNFIKKVLQRNQGNVTRTAKALGITRTALYRRLDKYGL